MSISCVLLEYLSGALYIDQLFTFPENKRVQIHCSQGSTVVVTVLLGYFVTVVCSIRVFINTLVRFRCSDNKDPTVLILCTFCNM